MIVGRNCLSASGLKVSNPGKPFFLSEKWKIVQSEMVFAVNNSLINDFRKLLGSTEYFLLGANSSLITDAQKFTNYAHKKKR